MRYQQQLSKMPNNFRAFFALNIPVVVQEKIALFLKPLKNFDVFTRAKWSRIENLHITLRFLGNINYTQYEKIVEQVALALRNVPGFTIDLTSLHFFPNISFPVALVLKPESDTILKTLVNIIDEIVVANGVVKENRPFIPHLTVAKFSRKFCLPPATTLSLIGDDFFRVRLSINEVILYQSLPSQVGSKYIVLNTFALC